MKYGILLFSGILLISIGSTQQVFAGLFDPCAGVDCNDDNPCTTDSCSSGICFNFAGNAGATCRAAVDTCDVAETCLGFPFESCPSDSILPSFITCRGAVDACDVPERCTGSSPFCPGDGFAPNGAECGPNDACQVNVCAFGNCAGIVTDCNDLDTCTADSCDPTLGCVNVEIPACFPDNGDDSMIGGEIIPIEHTSLILAGAQTFSWMIPVVLSVLGIGLFVVTRKNE